MNNMFNLSKHLFSLSKMYQFKFKAERGVFNYLNFTVEISISIYLNVLSMLRHIELYLYVGIYFRDQFLYQADPHFIHSITD